MSTPTFAQQVEAVVAAFPFGKASAAKRGRNPRFPYVPIIDFGEQETGQYRTRTEQIRRKAFEDRDKAVAHAQRVIDWRQADMRRKLCEPRYRAFRRQHGLPEELPA